jgi:hypothetical protein
LIEFDTLVFLIEHHDDLFVEINMEQLQSQLQLELNQLYASIFNSKQMLKFFLNLDLVIEEREPNQERNQNQLHFLPCFNYA